MSQNLGHDRDIIRVGDTVHRPVHYWTPAVHHLLGHLEDVGFEYSPRVRGFDAEGREVLTFIDGQSGVDGWDQVVTDAGLRGLARLVRDYHDAVAAYRPDPTLPWSIAGPVEVDNPIVVHGDLWPGNVVWRDGSPVGLIDWDMAHPGRRDYDILYALEWAIPLRSDENALRWHRFDSPPSRAHRIAVFLGAYGSPPIDDLAGKVAERQRETARHVRALAARGVEPQAGWVRDGTIDEIEARAAWTLANADLFAQ